MCTVDSFMFVTLCFGPCNSSKSFLSFACPTHSGSSWSPVPYPTPLPWLCILRIDIDLVELPLGTPPMAVLHLPMENFSASSWPLLASWIPYSKPPSGYSESTVCFNFAHGSVLIAFSSPIGEGGITILRLWDGRTHGTWHWTDEIKSSLLSIYTHSLAEENRLPHRTCEGCTLEQSEQEGNVVL